MIVETKLEFNSYLRLMYILIYKRPIFIVVSVIGLISFITSLVYFFQGKFNDGMPLFAGSSVILFYVPLMTYIRTKKGFYTNDLLKERITYEFTDGLMRAKGETFESESRLDNLHKVVELKDWFLMYRSNIIYSLIPKEALNGNLDAFREMIKSTDGIRVKKLRG